MTGLEGFIQQCSGGLGTGLRGFLLPSVADILQLENHLSGGRWCTVRQTKPKTPKLGQQFFLVEFLLDVCIPTVIVLQPNLKYD